jgi:hypothetical protein
MIRQAIIAAIVLIQYSPYPQETYDYWRGYDQSTYEWRMRDLDNRARHDYDRFLHNNSMPWERQDDNLVNPR